MDKHTPGPWIIEAHEKSASIAVLGLISDKNRCRASDGRGSIVVVRCAEDPDAHSFSPMIPEQVANARLIAAAPDLLEALKALANLDERCGWFSAAHDAALAAIAKAEGNDQ